MVCCHVILRCYECLNLHERNDDYFQNVHKGTIEEDRNLWERKITRQNTPSLTQRIRKCRVNGKGEKK